MQEQLHESGVDQTNATEQSLGDVDIVVENADIGKFNLVIWAIITVICVIYFFANLTP